MGYRVGSGFVGTDVLKVSVANANIVPVNAKPFYKFSFVNKQACKVKVNDSAPIFLDVDQGFNSNEIDTLIYTFVIVEAGIQYQWIGAY